MEGGEVRGSYGVVCRDAVGVEEDVFGFCFTNSIWVRSGPLELLDLLKNFEVVIHPQSPIN